MDRVHQTSVVPWSAHSAFFNRVKNCRRSVYCIAVNEPSSCLRTAGNPESGRTAGNVDELLGPPKMAKVLKMIKFV